MSTWNDLQPGIGASPIQRHRIAIPFTLGFLSGITAGGFFVLGPFLGYPVGRSGTGAAVGTFGSILGTAIIFAWLVWSMVNSGCPSCIDAVIFGWMAPLIYAVPFLIGVGIGSWRHRRATRSARAARS